MFKSKNVYNEDNNCLVKYTINVINFYHLFNFCHLFSNEQIYTGMFLSCWYYCFEFNLNSLNLLYMYVNMYTKNKIILL